MLLANYAVRTRNFRRRHFDFFINLHRIAVDYLAADSEGERNSQIAFARSSRSDDSKNRVFEIFHHGIKIKGENNTQSAKYIKVSNEKTN